MEIIALTNNTHDPDAQRINQEANSLALAIRIGGLLREVLTKRFYGDRNLFSTWVRRNLDISTPTVDRWLALDEHADLIPTGALRIIEAYRMIGIDGLPERKGA